MAVVLAGLLIGSAFSQGQEQGEDALPAEIPLWPGEPPLAPAPQLSLEKNIGSDSEPVLTDITHPSLRVFPASGDDGTPRPLVIVLPGGGYECLVIDREGFRIARWLNANGISAAVLKYRVSRDPSIPYRFPVQLTDARRAVRLIRSRAAAFDVDPARIGVMGFSAGGHLAASVSTLLDAGDAPDDPELGTVSARPDFAILVYPVISMGEAGHAGSRTNLLGPEPDEAKSRALSLENRVTSACPPVFLVHGGNDRVVGAMNSVNFYEACLTAKVPAELHLFQDGPHGFTLGEAGGGVGHWPDLLLEWMRGHGFAPDAPPTQPNR